VPFILAFVVFSPSLSINPLAQLIGMFILVYGMKCCLILQLQIKPIKSFTLSCDSVFCQDQQDLLAD
jgi:hypothetical protein